MSNTPIHVSTELSRILERIHEKLDTLQRDMGDVRIEVSDLRTESKREISNLRTETKQSTSDLRTETKQETSDLRTETKQSISDLGGEIKIGVESIKGDLKELQVKMDYLQEDIQEIKKSQLAQIWTLILILGTVVLVTLTWLVIIAAPSLP